MTLTGGDIARIMSSLSDEIMKNAELLGELDGAIGDGDLGLTMTKAFRAAAEEARKDCEQEPGAILFKVGMAIAKAAPSTMGTLVATGFMRGGKSVAGRQALTATDLSVFLDAFVTGIQERGKAKVGDKTILDVLKPASDALGSATDKDINEALDLMERAAARGLRDATSLMAQHGKAAAFREKTIGVQDPGGTVGFLILKAFRDGMTGST